MPSKGILGSYQVYSGTPQAIYVCGKSDSSVITLNVCNRNNIAVTIRVAISTSQTSPLPEEWFEYDVSVPANGYLERSSLIIPPGHYLVIRSSNNNVTAMCWGFEQGSNYPVSPITLNLGTTPAWVTSSSLPGSEVNEFYSQTLVASDTDGGALEYSLSSGTLPTGLSLSSSGQLSGVIAGTNTAGTKTFSVTVTDGLNQATQEFTLVLTKAAGTGGSLTTDSTYAYNTFTTSGTFTATASGYVDLFAWGGGGGGGTPGGWSFGAPGGAGGYVGGKFYVTSGQTYSVVVGGGGAVNASTYAVGGGGRGTNNGADNRYGSGGGGYSGIFNGSVAHGNAILIAGGGGGGGSSRAGTGNQGGGGGGLIGQDGASPYDGKTSYAGRGGTQSAAGAGASSDSANGGNEQGALQGGSPRTNSYGGGGGGGYYGGSAGGYSESNTMAGGGGGSSYTAPSVLNVQHSQADRTTPGNSSSPLRGSYGNAGGTSAAGTQGVLIVRYFA